MRTAVVLSFLLAAGCGPRVRSDPSPPAAAGPNLRVEIYEVVDRPEEDSLSYLVVSVDSVEAGRTEPGLKSERKRWEGRVAAGNRLITFERWVLPRVAEWQSVRPAWQPRERFVRVSDDELSVVTIRYYAGGRRYSLYIKKYPHGEAP